LLYLFPVEQNFPCDERREAFIARQMTALRAMGVTADALAREEALLRGAGAAQRLFAVLFATPPASADAPPHDGG
jgi:hypothetical protein